MGGINSSDMMLYAYLDERQTVCYWKKVAINIIARMVMNSYRGPGKLKSRYNYTVSIIKSLGTVLEQMILGVHEDSENSMKRKSPNALSAAQR
jgi:hypothetical protein